MNTYKKFLVPTLLLAIVVFSCSSAYARLDTKNELEQGNSAKVAPPAPAPYDPAWQGRVKSPHFYENPPNAAEKYKGKTLDYSYGNQKKTGFVPYLRDYGPGSSKPDSNPQYPAESQRTPYWMKKAGNRLIPETIRASLLRNPAEPRNQAILRLTSDNMLQTCARPGDLEYEKTIADDIYMDITLLGFEMPGMESTPVNCNMRQYRPAANVVLSRQELSGIKQIRFRTLYQIDYFNVILEDDYLALRPIKTNNPMVKALEDPRYDAPLEHWFYPDNTVLLFLPEFPENMDAEKEIAKFASNRGLTPLDQIVKSFRPGAREEVFYYVDPTGRLPDLVGDGAARPVGEITSWRRIQDISGVRRVPVKHNVYARSPGLYD